MTRTWSIVALCVLAVSLCLAFLDYRTNTMVTYWDGTETRKIHGEPIIATDMSIADAVCIEGLSCKVRSVAIVKGIYARWNISPIGAILGGLVIPYLLLLAASYLFFDGLSSRTAQVVSALILIPAGALLLVFSTLDWTIAYSRFDMGGRIDYARLIIVGLVTIQTLVSGLWMAARARQRRPS